MSNQKNPLVITEIKEIKNGAFQLTLSQAIVREGQQSITSILMQGHPGFGENKPAVSWVNVSAKQMAKYGFKKGDVFSEKFGQECNLQIVESVNPLEIYRENEMKYTNKLGVVVNRLPKMNPNTKEVMCFNNNPIYRRVILVVGEAKHTYIQHNSVIKTKIEAAEPADVLAD